MENTNEASNVWQQLRNMQADMANLHRENQELRAALSSMPTRANTPATTLLAASQGPVPAKKKLPNPPKFGGSKAEFPNWRETIRAKLAVDGAYIGTPEIQTYYVLALLEEDAALWAGTWRIDKRE